MPTSSRIGWATLLTGAALIAIFAFTVERFRAELQGEIHQKIIERYGAVMHPVALRQIAEREAAADRTPPGPADLLAAALGSARQEGMLSVAVFDANGVTLDTIPKTLLLAELPPDDFRRLLGGAPVSRYHPDFPLHQHFGGLAATTARVPVLEVLLPLHGRDPRELLGFAQYYLDARPLARELAAIDTRVNRQTFVTLAIGGALIALVLVAAYFGLRRAQRTIAERNDRLARANFELTLAVKASALGQITSHLLHGLQGPVAGLRAAVGAHDIDGSAGPDWASASDYADRLQTMIQETVGLLGDGGAQLSYELSGLELARIIQARNEPVAAAQGVRLLVGEGFPANIDGHRGSILCLIVSNLVANAVAASEPGADITVSLAASDASVVLTVADEGRGIPSELQPHLFTPGRSGRAGGTGLGLAISRLLAAQIGATLSLESTGPDGTVFSLVMPATSPAPLA